MCHQKRSSFFNPGEFSNGRSLKRASGTYLLRAHAWGLLLLCILAVGCSASQPGEIGGQDLMPLPVGRIAAICDLTKWNEVYVLEREGELRRITNVEAISGGIVWSEGRYRRSDGTWETRRIPSSDRASVFEVALSPDGAWLAYTLSRPGTQAWEIWIASAEGKGEPYRLTGGGLDRNPCWSADSNTIAFTRTRKVNGWRAEDIYVARRDEPDSEQLLANLGDQWDIINLAWSPDGETIVLERLDPLPDPIPPEGAHLKRSLWSLDVASREVAGIPVAAESAACPAWLPDGSRIVYAARRTRGTAWQICTCKPDASDEEILVGAPYSGVHPTVSPDGRHVAFLSDFRSYRRWCYRIHIVDTETEKVSVLTPMRRVSWKSISWSSRPDTSAEGNGD